jgi:uncharacterized protein DUF4352
MTYDPSRPPPAQQYPPGSAPPAPASRKRAQWPWIVGGILLAGIVGCVGLFAFALGGVGAVIDKLDPSAKGEDPVAGRMNTPIADGTFEFTVTGARCALEKVGSGQLSQQAQGQYCLVDLSVKNVGTSAQVFSDIAQTAFDASGNQYSADSGAAIYANKEYSTFVAQVEPGRAVSGKLVFDVPTGTRLESIVLHESLFSGGVKIPLK